MPWSWREVETKAGLIVYLKLVGVRNDVIKRQTCSVVLTVFATVYRYSSGDKFWRQKYFTEKKLKQFGPVWSINGENRDKITSVSLLWSRDMFVGSAFQFGFLPSKHYCSLKYTFELMLRRGSPTVNWFFPRRWIKGIFQQRISIGC